VDSLSSELLLWPFFHNWAFSPGLEVRSLSFACFGRYFGDTRMAVSLSAVGMDKLYSHPVIFPTLRLSGQTKSLHRCTWPWRGTLKSYFASCDTHARSSLLAALEEVNSSVVVPCIRWVKWRETVAIEPFAFHAHVS